VPSGTPSTKPKIINNYHNFVGSVSHFCGTTSKPLNSGFYKEIKNGLTVHIFNTVKIIFKTIKITRYEQR